MAASVAPAEGLVVRFPPGTRFSELELLDFLRLNPDLRVEQDEDGTLIVMSPAGPEIGAMNLEIAGQLRDWARRDGTGIAFDSSTGFRLPHTGSLRSQDASWVQRERWRALTRDERQRFPVLCPDFVLELRSASDKLGVLMDKMQEYQSNGARLGWLLDPATRTVWVFRAGERPPEMLADPATVDGDPVLPGFSLAVHEVWQAPYR